ncbi:hypothetical protein AWN88_11225 [Agrobacterium tumefaciens]|nr:hypothetical protein AWN88_11225 [Agrobacterium tumefaciens]
MDNRLASAIVREAERIGANPADLATVMSYETGGTFDPWKQGPTTKWGQHIGLIQMGQPQREKYNYYKGMPIEDAVRVSADYLVDAGFKPGMGLLECTRPSTPGVSGSSIMAVVTPGAAALREQSGTKSNTRWAPISRRQSPAERRVHSHRDDLLHVSRYSWSRNPDHRE